VGAGGAAPHLSEPWRQASYGGAAEPLIMEAQRALG
jgi:hypothetical protein